MKTIIAILLLSVSVQLSAAMTPKELFEKYKHAVVRIDLYYQGIRVSLGSGFFVSGDGHLITNTHVIKEYSITGIQIEISTFEGKVFTTKDIQIASHGGGKAMDFSLLKIPFAPKTWVNLDSAYEAPIGEQVIAIGHPQGLNYTLTNGLVSAQQIKKVRDRLGKEIGSFTQIQVSVPISPGNSGGPVLNMDGKLVAISTSVHAGHLSQNLNFGISGRDAYQGVEYEKNKLNGLLEERKIIENGKEKQWSDWAASDFDPLYIKAIRGEEMKPFFDRVKFRVPQAKLTYNIPIYGTFLPVENNCTQQSNVDNYLYKLVCTNPDQTVVFIFIVEKLKKGYLQELDGKPVAAHPLPLIKPYIENGSWEKIKGKLTEKQRKALFSMSQGFKCKDGAKEKASFLKDSTYCGVVYYNYFDIGAVSYLHSRQHKDSDLVESFRIVAPDLALGNYFLHTSYLARLGTLLEPL